MNWLITGGCGFIGTNLIDTLASRRSDNVRVVDNLTVGTREDLAAVAKYRERSVPSVVGPPEGIELVVADVRDAEVAATAARGVDAIVHLAANTGVQPSIEDPLRDCTTNVLGTLNYLEAARLAGVAGFVLASSGGTVIGDAKPPVDESMVPRPKAPYGASKAAGEAYCSAYAGTFGVKAVALRFSNVYGPRSTHKNSVVARFIQRALRGLPLEIYGDGAQTRDFLHVSDLVRAIIAAATTEDVGGEVFHIASGVETSIAELAVVVSDALRRAGIEDVTVGRGDALRGEIRRNYSTAAKAKRLLDWGAEVTLTDGLADTVAWFLESQGAGA